MTLTVSYVLAFGVLVLALIKFDGLRVGAGLAAALFGFYLAGTDAAASVHDLVSSAAAAFSDIGN